MPFTRISIRPGRSKAEKQTIMEQIYLAMRHTFAVAEGDRFMVVNEYAAEDFTYDAKYLGIDRTEKVIVIEITCNNTRTIDQKKSLYRDLVSRLEKSGGVRPDDVIVCLVEVAKENWSMGKGIASFA